MTVTKEVINRVDEKLRECIRLAEAEYGRTFRFPTVLYTKRGTTAGTANSSSYELNFNAVLLMENIEDFIARTVPHEMAHLIDALVNPHTRNPGWGRKRSVHGPTWKRVMAVMGADDDTRCHTYDTTNAKVKRASNRPYYMYVTDSGAVRFVRSAKKHNSIQRGARYTFTNKAGRKKTYGMEHFKRPVSQTEAGQIEAGQRPTFAPFKPLPVAASTAKTTAPLSVRKRNAAGKSKMEICTSIMRTNLNLTRAEYIKLFITEAGCTKAGAATYYQKLK